MPGRLVVISGPSGVGKDTVIDRWMEIDPNVTRVVAYTTRTPREGEVDGTSYHFVDRATFDAMAADGDFLEFKLVHGNFYATPKRDVQALMNSDRIAILKIDVQGAETVRLALPDLLTVFLMPPSEEELARRMVGRGTESEEARQLRLENARVEIESAQHYDHVLVNDDVDETVKKLMELTN